MNASETLSPDRKVLGAVTNENRAGDTDEADRRLHPRYPVKLRILFQRSGLTHFLEADAENISEGGVRIKTKRRPLDVGTELSVLIPLPDGELMLPGVVRWATARRAADPGMPQGMGIGFVGMDESTLARLRSLIGQLEPELDPPQP